MSTQIPHTDSTTRQESWETFKKYFSRFHASGAWAGIAGSCDDVTLKPDEYLMSSYPKCGTNWMLQILHQIRTGGDENFDFIFAVIPTIMSKAYLETVNVPDNFVHLETEHGDAVRNYTISYEPKIYFSHFLPSTAVPLGGRHIVVSRNPIDSFVSLYYFLPNMANIDQDKMSLEDFYFGCYIRLMTPDYYQFIADWYREWATGKGNLLWVMYEDLSRDLSTVVDRIADFMKVSLSPDKKATVLRLCSFEHMKNNAARYNPDFVVQVVRGQLEIPDDEVDLPIIGFVRKGESNYSIPQKIRDHMSFMWQMIVEPVTTCSSYEQLHAKMSLLNDKAKM